MGGWRSDGKTCFRCFQPNPVPEELEQNRLAGISGHRLLWACVWLAALLPSPGHMASAPKVPVQLPKTQPRLRLPG